MPADTLKFAQIYKVDSVKHEIWGLATEEIPDCDNEIFDFESSAPLFEAWSKERSDLTDGASKGVLREMHQLISAGKLIHLECDPVSKSIRIGAKVVNKDTWERVEESCLVAFSIGGRAVKKWKDKDQPKYTRFTAKPTEISVVDSPAVPTAMIESIKGSTYEFVKADGSTESRQFKYLEVPDVSEVTNTILAEKLERVWAELRGLKKGSDPKTKTVAGEQLPSSAFAYVGDPDKTETWKFPLHFSSEEKSKRHVRNALARWSSAKGIPDSEKPKVRAKIVAAAKKYGIEVSDEEAKALSSLDTLKSMISKAMESKGIAPDTAKSMQNITDLAQMLQAMRWVLMDAEWEAMYEFGGEGDPRDEAIAVEMQALIQHCIEILKDVVDDETSEIAATSYKAAEGIFNMKLEELSKAASSLHSHFKKAAAHHDKLAGLHKAKHEHHMAKAAEHKAAGAVGLEEMKGMHKAMAESHSFDAEHHMEMHKAHAAHAAHCNDMAEKCMGKSEEIEVAKTAAEIAAAEKAEKAEKEKKEKEKEEEDEKAAKALKGATPDLAKMFGDMTKAITDSIGALKADVETLKAQPGVTPSGVTLVPRPNGAPAPEKGSGKSFNYSDIGL